MIVEGDPDTEFEAKNYLKASTEIGPKVNRIESDALMYYFISDYAYEGDVEVRYTKIKRNKERFNKA